jgi:cell division FtsZ-interacting protein ZapD
MIILIHRVECRHNGIGSLISQNNVSVDDKRINIDGGLCRNDLPLFYIHVISFFEQGFMDTVFAVVFTR